MGEFMSDSKAFKVQRFELCAVVVSMTLLLTLVAGCSSSSSPASSSVADAGGNGVYELSDSGAKLTVSLPVAEGNSTVSKLQSYAKTVGDTKPRLFIGVKLENLSTESLSICGISLVTDAGATVVFKPGRDLAGDLNEKAGNDNASSDIYNKGVELYNSLLNTDTALSGATLNTVYSAESGPAQARNLFSGLVTQATFLTSACDKKLTKIS
jgi:hypothetical protein